MKTSSVVLLSTLASVAQLAQARPADHLESRQVAGLGYIYPDPHDPTSRCFAPNERKPATNTTTPPPTKRGRSYPDCVWWQTFYNNGVPKAEDIDVWKDNGNYGQCWYQTFLKTLATEQPERIFAALNKTQLEQGEAQYATIELPNGFTENQIDQTSIALVGLQPWAGGGPGDKPWWPLVYQYAIGRSVAPSGGYISACQAADSDTTAVLAALIGPFTTYNAGNARRRQVSSQLSTVLQEVSDKKLYAFAKIDDKVYRVVSYNTSPGEIVLQAVDGTILHENLAFAARITSLSVQQVANTGSSSAGPSSTAAPSSSSSSSSSTASVEPTGSVSSSASASASSSSSASASESASSSSASSSSASSSSASASASSESSSSSAPTASVNSTSTPVPTGSGSSESSASATTSAPVPSNSTTSVPIEPTGSNATTSAPLPTGNGTATLSSTASPSSTASLSSTASVSPTTSGEVSSTGSAEPTSGTPTSGTPTGSTEPTGTEAPSSTGKPKPSKSCKPKNKKRRSLRRAAKQANK